MFGSGRRGWNRTIDPPRVKPNPVVARCSSVWNAGRFCLSRSGLMASRPRLIVERLQAVASGDRLSTYRQRRGRSLPCFPRKTAQFSTSPESRRRAGTCFRQDLRHECGSRLLEAGWPLHHVKDMLGHASVSQTDTYLNASKIGLHDSMRRHDAKVACCKPVASEPAIEPPPARNEVSISED